MRTLGRVLALLVALEHIGIMILEMLFWNHPIGQRLFSMTPDVSSASATLAANQGLYNGFLAAGILWGLVSDKKDVVVFFLSCVVAAGIFGGLTAKISILLSQALPALAALVILLISDRRQRT